MTITNDVSQAAAAAAASSNNTTGTSKPAATSASGIGAMANEQTFLQLLVAQIQNQDPLSPTDSMQFVSQLAQFSSLEQLIGIHQSMNTLSTQLTSSTTTNTTGSTGTNPPSGQ